MSCDLFCAKKIVYLHICSVSWLIRLQIQDTGCQWFIYCPSLGFMHCKDTSIESSRSKYLGTLLQSQHPGQTQKNRMQKTKMVMLSKSKNWRGPRQVGKIPIFIGPESDLCLDWSLTHWSNSLNPVVCVARTVEDVTKSCFVVCYVGVHQCFNDGFWMLERFESTSRTIRIEQRLGKIKWSGAFIDCQFYFSSLRKWRGCTILSIRCHSFWCNIAFKTNFSF